MKTIAAVNLSTNEKNTDFQVRFLENDFHIIHIKTENDMDKVARVLKKWDDRADALAIENLRLPFQTSLEGLPDQPDNKLSKLCGLFKKPFSIGQSTLMACQQWTFDEIQNDYGERFFYNSQILFTSGMADIIIANNLIEYSDDLKFCDPLLSAGIPKILHSMEDLKLFAAYTYPVTEKFFIRKMATRAFFLNAFNRRLLFNSIKGADIIVVPHYCFFEHIGDCGIDQLDGKTVVSGALSTERLNFLKQRGVRLIVDVIPKMLEKVIGPATLESMMMIASGGRKNILTQPEIKKIIRDLSAESRVIFPFGK